MSGIIFINRNGLRWRDAPKEYGPHKTLYNRWKRWSDKGIFARMMAGLAAEQRPEDGDDRRDLSQGPPNGDQPAVEKGGLATRGRLIGRTKGGMNTKLHAICDARAARSTCS